MMKYILHVLLGALSFVSLSAQNSSNWSVAFQPQKVFIENKGQFDHLNNLPGSKVLFATENYSNQILFNKTGLTYRLVETIQPDKKERQRREAEMKGEIRKGKKISHQEMEKEEHRLTTRKDFVQMQWENANPGVEVVVTNPVTNYFNYGMKKGSIEGARGYQKLIYKNLYPNIDVEYVFHPESGIEYSFILHPGADASQIKMKYSDVSEVSADEKGNLLYPTLFGDIIEHAPQTFYASHKNSVIASKFVLQDNIVSIQLGTYDRSQEVVIDPWVQTPNLSLWKPVWECERDGVGNVYIIGGDHPMKLQKYNTAGVLQWTYSTTWVGDTADGYDWLGTMATDLVGNTYISNGSIAELKKINTNGTELWYYTAPLLSVDEYWSITFNCDQTKLIIGGTTSNGAELSGAIFEVNTNNGNVLNKKIVGRLRPPYSILGFPIPFSDAEEVRSLTSSKNARYYFLTLDSIGSFDQNLAVCPNGLLFNRNHGYNLGYKSETYRINNSGIKAIKANENFVYTQNGSVIQKRDLNTGAVLTSANIPGGINTITNAIGFTFTQAGNSGIDIDDCGNVYVGSANAVIKYDANLNQLSSVATAFPVFDVAVSGNGDVIACGATDLPYSTSRVGYVQSFAMSACAPITLACCDANICPAGPFCMTDGPVTLTPSVTSGTFSGPGITNPTTGVFNPSIAGPGIHLVTNTIGCGSGSLAIIVSPCGPTQACRETNGDITVSNGVNPYRWDRQVQQQNCDACLPPLPPIIPPCSFPANCATTVNVWQNFATGATITPPGTYPLQVTDELGTVLTITSLGSLPSCSACALTASASSTNSTCGNNGGSATVTAAGATPTGYLWSSGATTATATGLAAGNYTVTITSTGCDATASVTVNSSGSVSASASSTDAGCSNTGSASVTPSGGTGAFTYLWSNGSTASAISSLPAGSYTVTVTSGTCTATASSLVNSTGSVSASASSTNAGCITGGTASVTPNGGTGTFTYLWSNGQTTSSISNLSAATYTVTVTSGTCTTTASTIVGSTGGVTASASAVNAGCIADGSASVTPGGGTGTFTYLWSNGQTTSSISNLGAGTYTVTVTSSNCTATASAVVSASNSVSASATAVNAGCTANGSASVTPGGGNGTFTYLWSNGQTTSSISNLAAGTYTVTVTSNNCTATASAVVIASNAVTASPSSVDAGCAADGSASVAPAGGNGSFTYLWSNGGTTPTISNIAAGTYTVTVTSAGCTATASAIVSSTGSVTASTTTTNAGCTSTGSAIANAGGGTGSFTYLWNTGGATQSISNLSGGTYTVTVTSGSCTVTATAAVTSVGGIILSVSSQNTTCGNNTGFANVHANTGTGPFTYLWSSGATDSSLTNLVAGTYTVTVHDAGGCSATAIATVDPSAAIPAIITTTDSLICSGDSAQICVSGSNHISYNWNTGQTTQCINVKLAGNYYVTATDNANCTVSSNRMPLNIYPLPPVSISVNGDTLTAYNAVTYQWFLNNNPIPGATANVHIARQSGSYNVAVTDSNGCRAISNKVNVTITSVSRMIEDEGIKIYPNPLESGMWNLEVGMSLMGSEVEIFDAEGRLVYKSEIRNQKSEINLDAASGIYMLRISSNATNVTRKLIKL